MLEFQITYHQESEVQVTKLGEGPNSLVSSDDGLPTTRLKCFPLYSVLLAYSATTLDYLSLDSPDAQDGQVIIRVVRCFTNFFLYTSVGRVRGTVFGAGARHDPLGDDENIGPIHTVESSP